MAWSIEFGPDARRELEKLDKSVSNRILKFLRERVAPLDDPRTIGERPSWAAKAVLEIPRRRLPLDLFP